MTRTAGCRNDATRRVAEEIRANAALLEDTLDRLNQLAAGMGLDETIDEAANEVEASWYGREPMPLRRDDVDWQQLGRASCCRSSSMGWDR